MAHKWMMSGLALATMLAAGTAFADSAKVDNGMIVGEKNMTLYVFDKDAADSGRSACNGQCAQLWPPLEATAAASASGHYTIVARDDGTRQWAYDGKPLYYWSKDKAPGDTTGDGVRGIWHIARP